MKDTELEELLERLIASTRTPRGRFSAAASYGKLEKQLPRRQNRRLTPLRMGMAAATVALLCVMGWFAYESLRPEVLQTVSTLAEVRTVRLPDGSEITLNHYSSLTYPERFRQANREVTLNGEAYFEVAKDAEHPFIVQAEAVKVQVLGTHFNVEAYRNDPEVRTTLLEGSVAVTDQSNSARIVLRPNESAIYNKEKKSLVREAAAHAPEEIAWRHGKFIFHNLPLQEIVRQLSNSFGVDIRIGKEALRNYKLTASFTNGESLEQILTLLQQAGQFDYSRNNNQLTITPKPD